MTVSHHLKRIQVLLPADSYEILRQIAAREDRSVSALVRETIEEQLIDSARTRQKQEAFARLCSGDAPVSDWENMEGQIQTRWEPCQSDGPDRQLDLR